MTEAQIQAGVAEIRSAMDAVLRRAVLENDHAVVAIYREIYDQVVDRTRSADEKRLAAVRFGCLLGAELRRQEEGLIL